MTLFFLWSVDRVFFDPRWRHRYLPHALAVMATIDGTVLQAVMVPEEFHRVVESGVLPRWCAQIVPMPGERT